MFPTVLLKKVKMKEVVVFLVLLGFVLSETVPTEQDLNEELLLEEKWESYKVEYEKSYQDDKEELMREEIFKDNMEFINKHNLRYEAGDETYKMGINEFTDMSDTEFRNLLGFGYNNTNSTADIDYIYKPSADLKIPKSMDWRRQGAVVPVKNQYSCRSCWTFASAAVVETYHFRQTRRLVSLSEQNILDCSSGRPYDNLGCRGGWNSRALAYIRDHGVDTENSYRYENRQGQCRFKKNHVGARIRGVARVSPTESALAAAVANHNPVAVAIDSRFIKHYHSGVYTDRNCRGIPDHAVTVVGYGHEPRGGDYWIVKNSWGRNWGQQGYILMARNRNNQCNIASDAVYPV